MSTDLEKVLLFSFVICVWRCWVCYVVHWVCGSMNCYIDAPNKLLFKFTVIDNDL